MQTAAGRQPVSHRIRIIPDKGRPPSQAEKTEATKRGSWPPKKPGREAFARKGPHPLKGRGSYTISGAARPADRQAPALRPGP